MRRITLSLVFHCSRNVMIITVVNDKEGRNLAKLSISMSMSAAPILVALILSSSCLLVPAMPLDRLSREYLAAHNNVRRSHGEPPLQWDQKLEQYARDYSQKLANDCNMVHSYGPYGENLFWGERNVWTPTQVVDTWAEEKQYYDAAKNQCAPQQTCGHYTQVVWFDTTRVGCANVTCKNGGMIAMCSYGPPGNYVNEYPFKRNVA